MKNRHRLRMGSRSMIALNIAFGTTFLVCIPNYYFCSKKVEGKEKAIKLMMQVNEFDPIEEAPSEENNPFVEKGAENTGLDKEFYGFRKEKKNWEQRDEEDDTFKEVRRDKD